MNSPQHTLLVRSLSKSYHTAAGELPILTGVDLTMRSGEAVAVTGPSGSGKSTLLYLIGLLDHPTAGEITLDGENPHRLTPALQARFRGRHVGFVFQDHHLLPQCTVLENVLLPALAADGIGPAQQQRAEHLLDRVGLKQRTQHVPAQLSGGERQRVAVCRALINRPPLLLADEPTGNLDRKTADVIGTLLLELAREEQTMLVCVTHSQELAGRMPQHFELFDGNLRDAPAG